VLPAIEVIKKEFPSVYLSIDTYHAKVASETVAAGIDMVNDISAGELDAAAGMVDLAMLDDGVAEDGLGRAPGAQVDAGAAGVVDEAVFDAQALAGMLQGRDYWRSVADVRLLRRYERERKAALLPMDAARASIAPGTALITSPLVDIAAVARFAATADPALYPPEATYIRDADAKPQEKFRVARVGS